MEEKVRTSRATEGTITKTEWSTSLVVCDVLVYMNTYNHIHIFTTTIYVVRLADLDDHGIASSKSVPNRMVNSAFVH